MSTQRKQERAACTARGALEALKGRKTVHALARTYGVHPTPIAPWKHRLRQELPAMFSVRRAKRGRAQEALQAQGYHQIGQRTVEWDWLKNNAGLAP